MQSRGRGRGPGEGAPDGFGVGSRGWDFAGKAQRWQLRLIPRHCPLRSRAAQGPRAAPQSQEQKEAERPQSGQAQPWGWAGRGVPGDLDPGALVPRVERPVHPGGELTLWKEKSNCNLPKDVKLRRPASSRRAFASARIAEPSRAAPRRTAEPSRASRLGAGRRPRGSGP